MTEAEPLTAQQQQSVADLRAAVATSLESSAALRWWCTQMTLVRYLKARQWDLAKATKMLKATIEWRLTYKPHEITWAEVKAEAATGKQFRMQARDRDGRVVLVMRPRCQNSDNYVAGIRMLVYHLEASSQAADREGVGKMTWLIDFEGYTMATAPPLKVALQTASILQNHYPERLGLSVYYHPPRLFNLMWKAVRPFIDPVTLKKVCVVDKTAAGAELMAQKFDMAELEECFGGTSTWQFDLDAYSRSMIQEDELRDKQIAALEPPAAGGAVNKLVAASGEGMAYAEPADRGSVVEAAEPSRQAEVAVDTYAHPLSNGGAVQAGKGVESAASSTAAYNGTSGAEGLQQQVVTTHGPIKEGRLEMDDRSNGITNGMQRHTLQESSPHHAAVGAAF